MNNQGLQGADTLQHTKVNHCARTDERKHFFWNQLVNNTVNSWNSVPTSTVVASASYMLQKKFVPTKSMKVK